MDLKTKVINSTAEFIYSSELRLAFDKIKSGVAAVPLNSILPSEIVSEIRKNLIQESEWKREFWSLDDDKNVGLVSEDSFLNSPEDRKFSNNESLRKISESSAALIGFLSVMRSKKVEEYFTEIYGENINFCTADIARYTKGQYLRRHSDLFQNRKFGIVSFFNEEWIEGNGNEFIIEGIGGDSYVIPPKPGTAVLLNISPGYQHQVAMSLSSNWARYSVANHYNNPLP
ncbi:2OG-Fe(II) oxygenase [Rosenbergiella nectarea]|uniref:2OG-Fe(II) oxygenase n=1 Tax=Rosenbergiella nectarea TaxID=988801 RepID=UPI001F4F0501|nr:2OG-Fe(II) oxygenase [Rosenbergiella nectarea]